MNKKLLMSIVTITATVQLQSATLEELNSKFDSLSESVLNIQDSTTGSSTLDKISIGGYGKMDYINYADQDGKNKLDIYRFIMYLGYQFSDDIKLISELEWEHGGREKTGGYGIVEQAYLDFKLNDIANLKLGHMLVPIGYVNLYHEPIAFNSVNRPGVEKRIIPSTWHENGAIVYGSVADIAYQIGLVAGLNAGKGTTIRGMRQNGQKSKAEDFGMVARLDYNGIAGFNIGASIFTGDASQGDDSLDGVSTTVAEVHAGYNYQGFKIRALYAINEIDDAQKVAAKHESDAAGEGFGYYVNASYDINQWFTPFVRYETYNRYDVKYDQDGIKSSDGDITDISLGLNYKPTKNVVLKANYVIGENAKGKDDNRIELGTGYVF